MEYLDKKAFGTGGESCDRAPYEDEVEEDAQNSSIDLNVRCNQMLVNEQGCGLVYHSWKDEYQCKVVNG